MTTFMGYRRADGRVGVRNYVAVVSTVFCSASVAQKIAQATGAVAITHEGGCLELGPDREHTERVLRGAVAHPNVGAVLVVGLSCEQVPAESVAQAAIGKSARSLQVHDEGGTEGAIERGIEIVQELMDQAAGAQREPVGVENLILATQCGSSDTGSGLASNPAVGVLADKLLAAGGAVFLGETGSLYGAAGLMARRAVTPEVGKRIVEITDAVEQYYARMGKSLREANPTPGNIAGGLTTLVEKSLGGVRKGGTAAILNMENVV
jgi:altronate dehydratase large subunit